MRAVLMYHSLDPSDSPISLSPAAFERHLEWIVSQDIATSTFADLSMSESGQHEISLTFDDAFANFATEAWPRLKDRGLKATLFVVSGRVGLTNRWSGGEETRFPELPLLDWDALGRLAEEGCEIACHTRSHLHLPDLSNSQVEEEISSCLEAIETQVGIRPTTLAYPFGDFSESIAKVAASMVNLACTTEFALLEGTIQPMSIPRIDAWYFSRPGLFESFGTHRFGAFVKRRRFLRRLKRSLRIFRG